VFHISQYIYMLIFIHSIFIYHIYIPIYRLLDHDNVTIHGLSDNIQYAKTVVLLPFHDNLESESMNITTDK